MNDQYIHLQRGTSKYIAKDVREAIAPGWLAEGANGMIHLWNTGRLRGLEQARTRIGDLAQDVRGLMAEREKIKVLEVGCGYGKALLDLKMAFGDQIEIHGTNVEPEWNLELIRAFAFDQKLFASEDELERHLPTLHFLDASEPFPFPDASFDLIYSQAAAHYFKDKFRFLEEVNRLLTGSGLARIDINHKTGEYPVEYCERIEIWDEDRKVDFKDYMESFGNVRFAYDAKSRPFGYLIMNNSQEMHFEVELVCSFDLHHICTKWWGCKSIYKVKRAML